jgi:hypothetical protein
MAPTSCFNGQVHRLPDAPEAYGAMITRAKAAPGQSRYTDLEAGRPRFTAQVKDDASGEGSAGTGMQRRRSRPRAQRGERGGIPSRPPSPQAEPSRRGPWRPGRARHCTNDLDATNHAHSTGVWVDAGRDGSWESGEFRGAQTTGVCLRSTPLKLAVSH